MMEKAHPSSGYVNLALLMSQSMHKVVITTNFDHLLEDSLVQYAQTMPMVIGHEKLASYAMSQTSKPTIIKIHRDLLLEPINRPGELDKLNSEWEEVLSYLFSQYHPVFIGYAGNDNSVMDFLNQNVAKFNSDEWAYPYWMIYGSQEPEGKVRKFLDGVNGILIRHKGFDQVFILLCRALNIVPPDEETFLKKAKEQYEVILDSKLRGCSCDKPKIYRSVVTSNHSKAKERGKSLCRERIMEIFPARWKGIFTLDLLYFSLLS